MGEIWGRDGGDMGERWGRDEAALALPLASGATLADGMYLKSIPTGRGTRVPPYG